MDTYITMKMKCYFNEPIDYGDVDFGNTEKMTYYQIDVPINKPLERGIEDFLVMEMMKQVDKDPYRKVSHIKNYKFDTNNDSLGIFQSYERGSTDE